MFDTKHHSKDSQSAVDWPYKTTAVPGVGTLMLFSHPFQVHARKNSREHWKPTSTWAPVDKHYLTKPRSEDLHVHLCSPCSLSKSLREEGWHKEECRSGQVRVTGQWHNHHQGDNPWPAAAPTPLLATAGHWPHTTSQVLSSNIISDVSIPLKPLLLVAK